MGVRNWVNEYIGTNKYRNGRAERNEGPFVFFFFFLTPFFFAIFFFFFSFFQQFLIFSYSIPSNKLLISIPFNIKGLFPSLSLIPIQYPFFFFYSYFYNKTNENILFFILESVEKKRPPSSSSKHFFFFAGSA